MSVILFPYFKAVETNSAVARLLLKRFLCNLSITDFVLKSAPLAQIPAAVLELCKIRQGPSWMRSLN